MHLLFGNLHMENGEYECTIQSFENAHVKLANRTRLPLLIVSLVYPPLLRSMSKFLIDLGVEV